MRKFVISFGVLLAIVSGSVVIMNFFVDPLQFFRRDKTPLFNGNERLQNPGLARNYDYDSVVIGTSMCENFVPSYIEERLGWNTLRLAISGGSAFEERLILNLAIKTGKVKNVLWGLDYFSLRGETDRVRSDFSNFPMHMYDSNPLNDIEYLLDPFTTRATLTRLLKPLRGYSNELVLANLNNWNDEYRFGSDVIAGIWKSMDHDGQGIPSVYSLDHMKKNVDVNIEPFVRENPEIRFYFFFPPYSILQHLTWYLTNKDLFYNELLVEKYIYERLSSFENVEIYGLQNAFTVVENLDNYKDLTHYSQDINNFIVDCIAGKKYLLTDLNVDSSFESLGARVEELGSSDFNIDEFISGRIIPEA